MTHQTQSKNEFEFDDPEHEVDYYIARAYELRHEAMSQFMSDAGHGIANAYHATAGWIAQHLHRHPSTNA